MLGLTRAMKADRPLLYTYRRCPYAMRARMALTISGIAVDQYEVSLRDKPLKMLTLSPKGTVPLLVLSDGKVIDESLDIMRWALEQSDPDGWLGQDESLILGNDGAFKIALDRYKYPNRHGMEDTAIPRALGMEFLGTLDVRLASNAYLNGTSRSLTDIALFPFVRQFAATDRVWFDAQPVPYLRRWLNELIESKLFQTIMIRPAI